MTEEHFSKQSNLYEMFGLDFMLDDNLNLWFIECNASPQLIGTSPEKENFLTTMLIDMFEIQLAYFRSRMRRVFTIIDQVNYDLDNYFRTDLEKRRKEFAAANKNFIDSYYDDAIKPQNTFIPIIDRNRPIKDTYFGLITDECNDD